MFVERLSAGEATASTLSAVSQHPPQLDGERLEQQDGTALGAFVTSHVGADPASDSIPKIAMKAIPRSRVW